MDERLRFTAVCLRGRNSVSTLSQFTTYVETASNNQRLDIEHIQAYVVDELQRQNAAANHTKQICEQKLVELQYQLEDVSSYRYYKPGLLRGRRGFTSIVKGLIP